MNKIIPILAVLLACEIPLNNNPPSYVDDVVAVKKGIDGFSVYFTLADNNGAETTSDGKVTLLIFDTDNFNVSVLEKEDDFMKEITESLEIYSRTYNLLKSDFYKTKVGLGSFQRDKILYSFNRIKYSDFTRTPFNSMGSIIIKFETRDAKILWNGTNYSY